MKQPDPLRRPLGAITLLFLGAAACGPEQNPLDQKPTLFGMSVPLISIPLVSPNPFEDQLFMEYGLRVDDHKLLAHPELFVPRGTPITAASDGVVVQIEEVTGPLDLVILVQPDDAPAWRLGYEHVEQANVFEGNRIVQGQQIAIASSVHHNTFAKTTLMALFPEGAKNENTSYCPFLLMDDSVRDQIYGEIEDHVTAWETHLGREVFNDHEWHSPGCNFEVMTEQEYRNGTLTH